ncbi:MAG: 3'-5' exonuclease domain-containing protein 2 [Acidobacteriota bacterium]|jgi:ribonuclease D
MEENERQELTPQEINQLPLRAYEGPVHLVKDSETLARATADLELETVLGFDTETRPSFRKGESHLPALVQLATHAAVYLFQIKRIRDRSPLARILSRSLTIKTGVGMDFDVKQLREVFPFEPQGFVDLVTLSEPLGIKAAGLRNLAANLLGFRISKARKISNWARRDLTPAQITYAATDAWISRELYLKLKAMSL